jgi:hypothetical protein
MKEKRIEFEKFFLRQIDLSIVYISNDRAQLILN